jgi:hypothetical protein
MQGHTWCLLQAPPLPGYTARVRPAAGLSFAGLLQADATHTCYARSPAAQPEHATFCTIHTPYTSSQALHAMTARAAADQRPHNTYGTAGLQHAGHQSVLQVPYKTTRSASPQKGLLVLPRPLSPSAVLPNHS